MTALPGIGPQLGRLFERLAGPLVVDLLWHLPSGVIDRRTSPPVAALEADRVVTLQVRVEAHQPGMGRRPYRVVCADDTGILTLVYFNVKSDYLARLFPVGAERIVSGKVEFYNGAAQMPHPDLVLRPDELDRLKPIEPVYPLTAGLAPRAVQRAAAAAAAPRRARPAEADRAGLPADRGPGAARWCSAPPRRRSTALPELPEWIDPGLKQQRAMAAMGRGAARRPCPRRRGRSVARDPGARAARL